MPEWAYVIRARREGFITGGPTDEEAAIMSDHFDYLKSLMAQGRIVTAGRPLDRQFGLIIFEADDEDTARSIMESDPSVALGVMDATLHEYRTALLRGRD